MKAPNSWFWRGLLLFLISASVVFSSSGGSAKDPEGPVLSLSADLVLINGRVITVDPNDSVTEAVAIKGDKIAAVGTSKSIRRLIGKDTRVIDLKGLTATPGLIDAHCHFASGGAGMLYILDVGFPGVRKIADVQEKVKAKIATLKPGEWAMGMGWDEGKLEERRLILASDLDQVSPENPVWLMQTMGHYGVANTAALRLAKIGKNTPNPPAGTIDRSPDGTPTGVLKESAMGLVGRLIPPQSAEQIQKGIMALAKGFNEEGMTAAKDPGISADVWDSYQKVLAQGQLSVRLFVLWSGGRSVEEAKTLIDRVAAFTKPYISTGDDRLISGGIKLFMDGSGGARTGWVYDEWNKDFKDVDKGNYGYPVIEPGIFRQMIKMYHGAGLHVCVHSIGDKAIDWVVDSFAEALQDKPIHGLRHGIIHCNIPTDRAIAAMAEMEKTYDAGFPEAEAVHMWWLGDTYAGNFGPQRNLRMKPYKTFQNKGIIWAATSDFFVDPYPARYGIWAQIAREPLLGIYGKQPFGTAESVDVHAALHAYTIWAAHQIFLEKKIGSIEVGKLADIAVWDKNLYKIPTAEIKDLKCQMTLLGGKIVFQSPDSFLKSDAKH